ncbi:MAG: methanogenesis marker 17 protein [Candidatus Hodarchaeota archaeon]
MSSKVFVESVDEENAYEYGILAYQIITEFFMNDIQLSVVSDVRIIIDHEAPFFYIQINLGRGSEPPKVIGDVAVVKNMDDGIHITIRNETYAPQLLRFLWAKLGRNNVDQLDRWESVIPHKSIDINVLITSVIFDPVKVTMDKLSDFVYRIVPEGFRVQMNLSTPEQLKYIFSENPIENEWIDKVNKILERPPRPIPPEYLDKLRKAPRYIHQLSEKMDRASYTRKILTPWKTYDFEEFSTKQRADAVKFLSGQIKGKKKKVKKKGIKK